MLMPRAVTYAALAASLGPVSRAAAQGCAMCGTALTANDPKTIAFKWSVIFLLAAPYTLAATIGIWLYVLARRARNAPEPSSPATPE